MSIYNPYAPSYMQPNFGAPSPYQAQPAPMPTQQPMPPRTNKVLVAGLQDALARTNEPNTELLFVDQDNPFIYLVTVDMQGRKTYKTFQISEFNPTTQPSTAEIDLSMFATKEELKRLQDEINGLKTTAPTEDLL